MSSEGHGGRTREDDYPEINCSRIKIGGDLGGLIFVIAVVVCTFVGVPLGRAGRRRSATGEIFTLDGCRGCCHCQP